VAQGVCPATGRTPPGPRAAEYGFAGPGGAGPERGSAGWDERAARGERSRNGAARRQVPASRREKERGNPARGPPGRGAGGTVKTGARAQVTTWGGSQWYWKLRITGRAARGVGREWAWNNLWAQLREALVREFALLLQGVRTIARGVRVRVCVVVARGGHICWRRCVLLLRGVRTFAGAGVCCGCGLCAQVQAHKFWARCGRSAHKFWARRGARCVCNDLCAHLLALWGAHICWRWGIV